MKISHSYNIAILTAILLGSLSGYFSIPFFEHLSSTIITLFLSMLKLISLPMIFLAIISTMTKMKSLGEANFLIRKIAKYTLITTILASSIGFFLFHFLRPTMTIEGMQPEAIPEMSGSYLSFLLKIIPSNPIQPFLENNVLEVTFIAAILSIAILKLPENTSATVKSFFQGLFEALLKITSALIFLMPLGIFAFTSHFVRSIRNDSAILRQIFIYVVCVIGANLIQGLIVLPLLLKIKKIPPSRIARGMFPALTMAFFSKSSNATLPLSLECAKNRLKLDEKTVNFSFPLCSVINMNGCAAFIIITVLFVAVSNGVPYSFLSMLPWIFISTLAAIGNAGVPMGCFFLTNALLTGMKVPLEMMGFIMPLYSLIDMVETALNVWSDGCVTAIVDKEVITAELPCPVKI